VLAWAMDHDPALAGRLADALGWWWWQRGRLTGQYPLLSELAGRTEPGSDGWCAAHLWLGWAAMFAADQAVALGHFTAVYDAVGDRGPSRVLADALAGRSSTLLNTGRLAEGAEDGRRSLVMARELGYLVGEGNALRMLAIAALYRGGDHAGGVVFDRPGQPFRSGFGPGPQRAATVAAAGRGDDVVRAARCWLGVVDARQSGHPFAVRFFPGGQPGPHPALAGGGFGGGRRSAPGRITIPLASAEITSSVEAVHGTGTREA
jgi:hypothetical protein